MSEWIGRSFLTNEYKEDADVVAFPDYNWSGNDIFDPYKILNPNYDPSSGGDNTGGGSGTGSPGSGSNNSSNFFTESEFNNVLTTLSNSLNGDPIELYLIASYKNSKLLNSSTYSVGSNSITVGEYTLTPHYDSNNVLRFYTASRNTSLGIEYIVRADALTAFQGNYSLYQAAANAFYINGIPTQSQIQIASGDFLNGLVNSWADAITDPAYYAYLTHVLYGVGVNLPAGSNTVLKPLGLGSTGRMTANNLNELLAMKEIMSNPNRGFIVPNMPPLTDSRWTNWRKMQYEHIDLNGSKTVIHYNGKWENGILKAVDDFKFNQ